MYKLTRIISRSVLAWKFHLAESVYKNKQSMIVNFWWVSHFLCIPLGKTLLVTRTWFEHATFWTGVRRATVAPPSLAIEKNHHGVIWPTSGISQKRLIHDCLSIEISLRTKYVSISTKTAHFWLGTSFFLFHRVKPPEWHGPDLNTQPFALESDALPLRHQA